MRDTTSRFVSFSIPASWTRKRIQIRPQNLRTQAAILKVPHLHIQGFTQQAALSWEQVQGVVQGWCKRPVNTLEPRFRLCFYCCIPVLAAASFSAAQLLWTVVTRGGHFSLSAISEGWWTPPESGLVTRNYPCLLLPVRPTRSDLQRKSGSGKVSGSSRAVKGHSQHLAGSITIAMVVSVQGGTCQVSLWSRLLLPCPR